MNRSRIFFVAIVLAILGAFANLRWSNRILSLPSDTPSQARITIFSNSDGPQAERQQGHPTAQEFQTSDSTAINKLVAALQEGRSSSDHKCAAVGTIQLAYPFGEFSVTILPGHTKGFYEVRWQGDLYRIPQEAFTESLAACGVIPAEVNLRITEE